MQTITFECEINADRHLMLQLPRSIAPGHHRIAVLIDPPETKNHDEAPIAPLPEETPPRTALWAQLTALREQAQQEGVLPEPMTWDEILAEAAHRRDRPNE